MCGRFALYSPASKIAEVFEIVEPPEILPRYNVAPTDDIACIVQKGPERRLGRVRWGLVPWFTKEMKGPPLLNARSETIAGKPVFKKLFRERRCLIPAAGFYEWKKEGKLRLPSLFRRKDHAPMGFAGLWDTWHTPAGERLVSCTILTTAANALVEPLHDRMPVALRPELWADWLNVPDDDLDRWAERLAPYPAEEMERVAVSTRVNSVKNDAADLIEPATT